MFASISLFLKENQPFPGAVDLSKIEFKGILILTFDEI